MEKFCGKCGKKLDRAGKCPKCEKTIRKQNNKDLDVKKRSSKGNVIRIIRLVIGLCMIFIILAGIILGCGMYFNVVEIPMFENLFMNQEDNDLNNTDNYESLEEEQAAFNQEYLDADAFFGEKATIISTEVASDSKSIQTEAEVYKMLFERGFTQQDIIYEYTIDGENVGENKISNVSTTKHPVYEMQYITSKNAMWTISVINGEIFAYPVSYNLNLETGVELIISETDALMSYDCVTNTFYHTIPHENVICVETVLNINAETLDKIMLGESYD